MGLFGEQLVPSLRQIQTRLEIPVEPIRISRLPRGPLQPSSDSCAKTDLWQSAMRQRMLADFHRGPAESQTFEQIDQVRKRPAQNDITALPGQRHSRVRRYLPVLIHNHS